MKRSNVVFLAIAAIVAIGAVMFYMNYPPVDQRDAQGSIGAVQKYRSEQISTTGVVLADEQTRLQEAQTYGNLLEQATQLQAMSASLGFLAQTLDAKQQTGAKTQEAKTQYDSVSKQLDSRTAELNAKLQSAVADLASRSEMQGFKAQFDSITASLNAKQMNARELEAVSAQLGAVARDLGVRIEAKSDLGARVESKSDLGARVESKSDLGARVESKSDLGARVEAKSDLGMKNLAEAKTHLDAVSRDLGSKTQFGARDLEAISAQLGAVTASLGRNTQMESRSLGAQIQQLNSMVLEAQTLFNAKEQLNAIEQQLGTKSDLGMNAQRLESISASLGVQANHLESMAVENLASRLEARGLYARTLDSMKSTAESISRDLGSRYTGNRSDLGAVQASLDAVEKGLNSRLNDLGQKVAFQSRAEMNAISSHLDAQSSLGVRMGARDLGAKSLYSQNLESFNQYLGSMTQSMNAQSTLSAVERDALGKQAEALQSRANDMGSRSN